MFYRASDPTLSTNDWIRLNTNEINQSIVEKLVEARARSSGGDPGLFELFADGADEDEHTDEDRDLLPMWGAMWELADKGDNGYARDALLASGFRVYEAIELDFDGLLFGIEGAGYDFHAAHWIPLRARIVANLLDYRDAEEIRKLYTLLAAESSRGGGSDRDVAELAQLLKVQR